MSPFFCVIQNLCVSLFPLLLSVEIKLFANSLIFDIFRFSTATNRRGRSSST